MTVEWAYHDLSKSTLSNSFLDRTFLEYLFKLAKKRIIFDMAKPVHISIYSPHVYSNRSPSKLRTSHVLTELLGRYWSYSNLSVT
ncbi:hypothetical protein THF1D04_40003 [Vibrio owensii]|uniref:Transposase n=1 Tax=Vibrio owensii TaxID=696485 RepID=A0AAU9Q9X4_9VIBR|nr:hypothetical protein THF1D04_40003 [Vibrio owensii]